MKFPILPLIAICLLMAVPANTQTLHAQFNSPRMNDVPRTKRERDFGLEGQSRGRSELSAPDDDEYSTEEPDYDEDDLEEVLPPGPRFAPQRL